jgi:hypothetical protein
MFVELDAHHDGGLTVSLERDRDSRQQAQIVVSDARTAIKTAFAVTHGNAAGAFRRRLRYVP